MRLASSLFSVTVVVAACTDTEPCMPTASPVPTPLGRAVLTAQLTGAGSVNDTDSCWSVTGTDLGITWDDGQGHVMLAFGDTYGLGGSLCDVTMADHRDNVLAIASDRTPDDGIQFDRMVADSARHAAAITLGAHEACSPAPVVCPNDGCELQRIPSGGVSVGTTNYLAFMSMRQWCPDPSAGLQPGDWLENFGGIMRSEDDGNTWQEIVMDREPCGSNFTQINFAKDDTSVYVLGAPQGKHGALQIARTARASFEERTSWTFWNGVAWGARDAAAFVVPPPVAEMSIVWNSYYQRWIMAHRDKAREAIVWRAATQVAGPWSGEHILIRSTDSPLTCTTPAMTPVTNTVYGPMIHPWFNDGPTLYFNASQWVPYNVFSFRATLAPSDVIATNLVTDPGFEEQTGSAADAPWCAVGATTIDRATPHSGAESVRLDGTSGASVGQTLAVVPGATYHVSAWVWASAAARLVVRERADSTARCPAAGGGQELATRLIAGNAGYVNVQLDVTIGALSLVDVVVEAPAGGGPLWLDDVDVEP